MGWGLQELVHFVYYSVESKGKKLHLSQPGFLQSFTRVTAFSLWQSL